MGNKALMSRAIRYQKTASDNMFTIVATLQSSSEKMVKETLNQYSWLPDGGKKGLIYWYDTCSKTTEGIKQMVDQGYEQVQKYIDSPATEQQTVKPASKAPAAVKVTKKVSPAKKPPVSKAKAKTATPKSTAAKTTTTKPVAAKKPPAKTTAAKKTATKPATSTAAATKSTQTKTPVTAKRKATTPSKATAPTTEPSTGK